MFRLGRLEFWWFVFLIISATMMVHAITNSRCFNPVCPSFAKQNPELIEYEDRAMTRQMRMLNANQRNKK